MLQGLHECGHLLWAVLFYNLTEQLKLLSHNFLRLIRLTSIIHICVPINVTVLFRSSSIIAHIMLIIFRSLFIKCLHSDILMMSALLGIITNITRTQCSPRGVIRYLELEIWMQHLIYLSQNITIRTEQFSHSLMEFYTLRNVSIFPTKLSELTVTQFTLLPHSVHELLHMRLQSLLIRCTWTNPQSRTITLTIRLYVYFLCISALMEVSSLDVSIKSAMVFSCCIISTYIRSITALNISLLTSDSTLLS